MGRRMKPITQKQRRGKEQKKTRRNSKRSINKKKVTHYRFEIDTGKASPSSCEGLVGKSLSRHGVNVEEFCERFNKKSVRLGGFFHLVDVVVFDDKSFKLLFHCGTPLPIGHPSRPPSILS